MSMVPHRTKQITFDLAIAASTLVKLAHKHDSSLHRAVDKAAPRLINMPWRVVEGKLEIASASQAGEIQVCDNTYCSCPTVKGICWHQGAWTILSAIAATGVEVEAALPLPDMAAIDDQAGIVPTMAQAAADALYGDNADRFNLGHVVMTPGVAELMDAHRPFIIGCLSRHANKDWGDISPKDLGLNDQALRSGARLLSVYHLQDGTCIWIITDAADDNGVRNATTLLLPSEY